MGNPTSSLSTTKQLVYFTLPLGKVKGPSLDVIDIKNTG